MSWLLLALIPVPVHWTLYCRERPFGWNGLRLLVYLLKKGVVVSDMCISSCVGFYTNGVISFVRPCLQPLIWNYKKHGAFNDDNISGASCKFSLGTMIKHTVFRIY